MPILSGSRYSSSTVISVNDDGQTRQVITPSAATAYTFSYISHMVTARDRLDLLANQYYGDSTLWWHICDSNPEIISWLPMQAPGTVIRIPSIT